jgi:hypothetical protein
MNSFSNYPQFKPGDAAWCVDPPHHRVEILQARKARRRSHQNVLVREQDGTSYWSVNTCWWPSPPPFPQPQAPAKPKLARK